MGGGIELARSGKHPLLSLTHSKSSNHTMGRPQKVTMAPYWSCDTHNEVRRITNPENRTCMDNEAPESTPNTKPREKREEGNRGREEYQ